MISWSNSTSDDDLAIIRDIARENPDAAGRVADRVDAAAAALTDFATGRSGRVQGTYVKVLSNLPYILAYEIVTQPDGNQMVAIMHVIHGAHDWQAEQWPPT